MQLKQVLLQTCKGQGKQETKRGTDRTENPRLIDKLTAGILGRRRGMHQAVCTLVLKYLHIKG